MQISLGNFVKILLYLVDKGNCEDIKSIEENKSDFVKYIKEKYSDTDIEQMYVDEEIVNDFITNVDFSTHEIENNAIENNGLLFLAVEIVNSISAGSIDEIVK